MSFDAGTIKGKLDLDTTSFKQGFEEAHTHAQTHGGHVREILESLAEVATELVGPAFAQLGHELQSAFAGFSEGPAIGALNVMALAAGNLRESTLEVGEKFEQIGLGAQKAGIDVEQFSTIVGVASTKSVGIDQLVIAFKNLQEKAVEAADNKNTAEYFNRLGISIERAGELSKEPAKLFEAMQEGMSKIPNYADRLETALHILGQRNIALVPLLAMSREEFDKTGTHLAAMGGVVTEANVKQGEALKQMTVYWNQAMEGIRKAIAVPILDELSKNMDPLEAKLEAFSKGAVVAVGAAWKGLGVIFESIKPTLESLTTDFSQWFTAMGGMPGIMNSISAEFKAVWPEVKSEFSELMQFLREIEPLFIAAAKAAGGLSQAVQLLTPATAGPGQSASPSESLKSNVAKSAAEALALPGGSLDSAKILLNTFTLPGQIGQIRDSWNSLFGDSQPATPPGQASHGPPVSPTVPEVRGSSELRSHINEVASKPPSHSSEASNNSNPRQSGNSAVNQTIQLSVKFDPHEAAQQFAAKLVPALKQLHDQHSREMAGAAAAAAVDKSMGGN